MRHCGKHAHPLGLSQNDCQQRQSVEVIRIVRVILHADKIVAEPAYSLLCWYCTRSKPKLPEIDTKIGSYASPLIQALGQIRTKKRFGLRSRWAGFQLESFFPTSANLRKSHN